MEELQHWIHFNLNNAVKLHDSIAWCDLWALSCHCLWTWRNKEQHIEEFVHPPQHVQYVMKMLKEYLQALKINKAMMGRE
jgi:hypothetical protein